MHSKGGIFCVFISLLLQSSANSAPDELKHLLETKSSVDLAEELDELNSRLWNPQTNALDQPDHWIFRQYPLPQLNLDALASAKRKFDENFSWSSISLLSLPHYNLSYILLGGSWSRHVDTPYPREDGIVQLCNFTLSPSGQLTFRFPCQDLSEGLRNTAYLGAASSSLQISENMGLLAYCDPLWMDDSYFPAGRCYLQLIHNENIRPRHELASFCRTGGKVTEPCMTGFSVDLMSKGRTNSSFLDFLKGIHVIVGQPLASGFGRAQILANPFYNPRTFTVYRPSDLETTLHESYFGYSVAGEYVSIVGTHFENGAEKKPEVSELTQLFKVDDLQNIRTAGGVEFNWQGRTDIIGSFSGFGTSMINLKSANGEDIVVVGAPYATKGGRVYIYCIPTNLAIENKNKHLVPTDSYRDFVAAPAESGAFGYSLTALGDIDGDGQEDIAVGSPQLRDKSKSGRVFILRILTNCTFDRRPLQVIDGPEKTAYFGSVLPRKGMDLDFNNQLDFALSVPYCASCVPMVYSSRPRYHASCRFYQPNWLGSVHIRRNTRIPIKLKVRLIPSGRKGGKSLVELLQAARVTLEDLVHQIIPDLWAKKTSEQRVRLSAFHSIKLNPHYDMLSLKFDLLPQMDVEDMPSLEQPDGAIRIAYRFNIPCPTDAKSVNTRSCADGAWVHRPIIDWTGCSFQLRLTKYVCLPKGRCESDVSLRVIDEKSGKIANSEDLLPRGETVLIYGDKESAMSKLIMEVYNKGPTFAGGVWINIAFLGNMRFSAFEVARRISSESGGPEFKTAVCSHPLNNDSWVACKLGRLEYNQENASVPVMWIRLTSFYVANVGLQNTDFTLPSYVNISISSQTYDPQAGKNFVIWYYQLLHAPKYLITPAGRAPSSVMDNRTKPTSWGPGFHQRIMVDEMGPRLNHTFQVEHMGPTQSVNNITIRLNVPVRLVNRAKSLVYLFNEVRSPAPNGIDMEWVSLRPVVKLISASDGNNGITRCWYNDESLINPNGWIGIDMQNRGIKRSRREASNPPPNSNTEYFMPLDYNNTDVLEEAAGRFGEAGPLQKVSFRRVPKEVIQCGRVGQKFGKPLCLEIVCRLRELKQKHPVQISVTGWLYAPTYFQYSTSDIEIVTTLTVDQGAVPKGIIRSPEPVGRFEIPQVFFFTKIKPTIFHQIPIWPIVVGLVLGILLLAFLIIILYRFGFFRRRKHKLAVSGRRRWRENLDEEASKHNVDGIDGPVGEFDTFSSIRYAEEARKRRLKLRKHPEEMSILHPDEIPKVDQGQENQAVSLEHPSMASDVDTAKTAAPEGVTTSTTSDTVGVSGGTTKAGD